MKHKFLSIAITFVLGTSAAQAVKLSDYSPYDYEVLFTNPVCKQYNYDTPMVSNSGYEVEGKVKNAYCKSGDSRRSAARKSSPHQRLLDWIKDENTTEIFMAYLSFSKKSIATALCNAVKERNVKLTLIMDKKNEEREGGMSTAYSLKKCKPKNLKPGKKANKVEVYTGGHSGAGSNKTGYAHNKLFFVNPGSLGEVRIAFSSGNMSSGTTTHHENWHFVTTSGESYFADVHRCLQDGLLNYDDGIKSFSNFIKKCRAEISAKEESDIKVFFVPGEGSKAMAQIKKSLVRAESVDLAAHRFSNRILISALGKELKKGKSMRLVVDDDIYWTGVYGQGMGRNMTNEQRQVESLEGLGLEVQYMETAADAVFDARRLQLQHNKFLVFNFKGGKGAVFAGAGNLTTSAFKKNFENFYYISIPSVYKAFVKQYDHFWNTLTVSADDMPDELVLP